MTLIEIAARPLLETCRIEAANAYWERHGKLLEPQEMDTIARAVLRVLLAVGEQFGKEHDRKHPPEDMHWDFLSMIRAELGEPP